MNILKGKNVNLALMLFVVTLFEVTCLFTLLSKAEEQYKMNIIITMGVYILVQYAYFFGAKIILKRKSFDCSRRQGLRVRYVVVDEKIYVKYGFKIF